MQCTGGTDWCHEPNLRKDLVNFSLFIFLRELYAIMHKAGDIPFNPPVTKLT